MGAIRNRNKMDGRKERRRVYNGVLREWGILQRHSEWWVLVHKAGLGWSTYDAFTEYNIQNSTEGVRL